MATFSDLDPLPFFGKEAASSLRAIGWLGREQAFQTGATPQGVYRQLQQLFVSPFQPILSAGAHGCELCQHEAEATGSANLFVPADGLLFVCPELIMHYINAHRYQPPGVFLDAVLACPDTRSAEYKRLFLANGGRALMRQRK